MESAFMARKDERSTRLRQASGAAGAQDSTPNAEFSEETLHEVLNACTAICRATTF
jgi:hypothetical protein